jgi:TetR/AcrR family transcriptional regulator, ethionamide resistance regulator
MVMAPAEVCDTTSQQAWQDCDTVSTKRQTSRVPAAEARQRIEEAAARLLAERPFRELTVDMVMAEAGLARTVFYRHFAGLPHLLVARLEDLREALSRAGDPLAPGYTEAVLRRAVEVFAEHGAILRAIDDAARRDADVEVAYREFTEWAIAATAELFDLGIEAGNLEPFDTRNVARALTLLNRAYLLDALTGEHPHDREVVVRTLMTVWARTLQVES